MKYLLLLCLIGCNASANVIDSHDKFLGWCGPSLWVTCVAKFCPNGYDIPVNEADPTKDSTIKCK